jgi:phosphoglycolate phosphatase-like HAD superfamily hydrolase
VTGAARTFVFDLDGTLVDSGGFDGRLYAEAVREEFGRKIARYLAAGGECRAIRGAAAALEELRASGHRVGIATGGFGHTARMKLEHVGLPTEGLTLASSDDGYDRAEIMRLCLARLGGDAHAAVYVGDGPWDLEATRRAGWSFVGIGPRLAGRCEMWIEDFADPRWAAHCAGE